jgi:uncharacterized protein
MVGLGRGATIRGKTPDYTLEIAEADILPEDILMLSQELNLRETTPTTLEALRSSFQNNWFHAFKHMRVHAYVEDEEGKRVPAPDSVEAWAIRAGVHPGAAEALHSKLRRLFNAPYIVEEPAGNALGQMIENLDHGQHVVLSFGRHESDWIIYSSPICSPGVSDRCGRSAPMISAAGTRARRSPARW